MFYSTAKIVIKFKYLNQFTFLEIFNLYNSISITTFSCRYSRIFYIISIFDLILITCLIIDVQQNFNQSITFGNFKQNDTI